MNSMTTLKKAKEKPFSFELFKGYPDLLTVKHIQELTGLSDQTIRAEMSLGNLPSCRIGRRLYCPKTLFVSYVEGRANAR